MFINYKFIAIDTLLLMMYRYTSVDNSCVIQRSCYFVTLMVLNIDDNEVSKRVSWDHKWENEKYIQ